MIKTDLKQDALREKMYKDIGNRLLQLVDKSGKPIVQTIDIWNNQWQYLDKEKPFNFPSVFIEFQSMPWTPIGGNAQQSTVTIGLHIGTKSNAPSRFGNELSSKWLQSLRIVDAIYMVMNGWGNETGYMGSFTRVNSIPDHDFDDIKADLEVYRVTVKDTCAMPEYIKKKGDLFVLDME